MKQLRTALPIVLLVLFTIGLALRIDIGNLSALGWGEVALLCPVGALATMLAEKALIPHALISLAVIIALTAFLGHAFCGWVCPIPSISKLRGLFAKKKTAAPSEAEKSAPLSAEEQRELEESIQGCKGKKGHSHCGACASPKAPMGSRYIILGGALASALLFGFPVFCLVCPVGLSIASVLLIMRLFAFGDVSWTVVVVPALLVLEVVVFRKWCHAFCPISAFMSIFARANRTFRPTIDNSLCLETTRDVKCERCAAACPEGINPRIPELGTGWNECIKCRSCAEACPTQAITLPLLPPKEKAPKGSDHKEQGYA